MSLDRVASQVPISVLVATNLVRDQLDRYGETDAITRRWRPVISNLPAQSTLVVCADDPRLMYLAAGASARIQTFGLAESPAESLADPALTPEAVTCPVCDGLLARRWVGLGHLGDFTCTGCSFERKRPSIAVRVGESHDFAETHMTLLDAASGTEQSLTLAMPGVSNAYNAVAAVTAVVALGVPFGSAVKSLSGLRPPWGRYERVDIDGREVILSLGKNPASVAELVRIGASADVDSVVVGVNDAAADGRDASWYWDVDLAPLLAGRQFLLAGTRRLDLALRLKYSAAHAGHTSSPAASTADSPADALTRMVAATPPGGRVFVVLTYTALLELRSVLAARMLLPPMPA
jgi:UDP-N-acetylmuramyl tripeptide synthase